MNTILNRSAVLLATVVATTISLAAATPLRAAPVSVDVAYSDVDLHSDAGIATLKQRIRRAASTVCNQGAAPLATAACRSKAVASAEAKLASIVQTGNVQLAAR